MDYKVYSVEKIEELSVTNTKPGALYIKVKGIVPTGGWTNASLIEYTYVQPPTDGIWDFDFKAQSPEGRIVTQGFTHIRVEQTWHGKLDVIKGVRIHSSTNQKEMLLVDAPTVMFLDLRGGGGRRASMDEVERGVVRISELIRGSQ